MLGVKCTSLLCASWVRQKSSCPPGRCPGESAVALRQRLSTSPAVLSSVLFRPVVLIVLPVSGPSPLHRKDKRQRACAPESSRACTDARLLPKLLMAAMRGGSPPPPSPTFSGKTSFADNRESERNGMAAVNLLLAT